MEQKGLARRGRLSEMRTSRASAAGLLLLLLALPAGSGQQLDIDDKQEHAGQSRQR